MRNRVLRKLERRARYAAKLHVKAKKKEFKAHSLMLNVGVDLRAYGLREYDGQPVHSEELRSAIKHAADKLTVNEATVERLFNDLKETA